MFYQIIKHTHSGLRWLVLLFILIAIVTSLVSFIQKKSLLPVHKKLYVFALSFLHTQFLVGLLLYFLSPKVIFSGESMSNQLLRFFLVEHSIIMLLAVILLTVGYSLSKKADEDWRKHRRIFIFYLSSLIIIFIGIPWPWMNLTGSWI